MKSQLRPAIILFFLLTLLCCGLYPALVTGIGQLAFPAQAAGSLILQKGRPIGSVLIGQAFNSPQYFKSRPSATLPMEANATASGGSNLGPNNPALIEAVTARIAALKAADPTNTAPVPVDLVTSSASGLDPEISLAAAYYQASRVAQVRGLPVSTIRDTIARQAGTPVLGLLGEPRINVLQLNLALDRGG